MTASSAASRCLRNRSAKASSCDAREGAGWGCGAWGAGRGANAAVPGRGAMGAGRATTFDVTCCPPAGCGACGFGAGVASLASLRDSSMPNLSRQLREPDLPVLS
ncbi:MAG: hypothetical protein V2I51_12410 [Anderseniella sp.]|nr:hypothetical protein [Anderseniella sp.]